ncbi:unnamed protein product [Caenorhabditis bovis]|uniref:SPK domain-containing protein n=1 Tax=Caenorhabditis bovis TaxID=2654633 RepID=A0A8S1FE25_9PELO|nr:unnamed protein product [Caenorhabditis bovis]
MVCFTTFPLVLFYIIPFTLGLYDNVEDKNIINNKGQINIVEFGREALEILREIIPKQITGKQKKKEFLDFCKKYGDDNQKAIIRLTNTMLRVYNEVPDNLKTVIEKTIQKFESKEYQFDDESFEKIAAEFEREYEHTDGFQLLGVKLSFDRYLDKFRELFYNPLTLTDHLNHTSDMAQQFKKMLDYIFEVEQEEFNDEHEL